MNFPAIDGIIVRMVKGRLSIVINGTHSSTVSLLQNDVSVRLTIIVAGQVVFGPNRNMPSNVIACRSVCLRSNSIGVLFCLFTQEFSFQVCFVADLKVVFAYFPSQEISVLQYESIIEFRNPIEHNRHHRNMCLTG